MLNYIYINFLYLHNHWIQEVRTIYLYDHMSVNFFFDSPLATNMRRV